MAAPPPAPSSTDEQPPAAEPGAIALPCRWSDYALSALPTGEGVVSASGPASDSHRGLHDASSGSALERTIHRLVVGKNVVGRSVVPVNERWFINVPSPQGGVSRAHAKVVIAANGDAWIEDNASTNGTYLALSESGLGVLLEQGHYYQLSIGARITLGDCEAVFQRYIGGGPDDDTDDELPHIITARSRATSQNGIAQGSARAGSKDVRGSTGPAAAAAPPTKSVSSSKGNASSPGLEGVRKSDSGKRDTAPLPSPVVTTTAKTESKRTDQVAPPSGSTVTNAVKSEVGSKRSRSAAEATDAPEERSGRPSTRGSGGGAASEAAGIVACFSGMDSKSKADTLKLLKALGAEVVDEWEARCNLLIVQKSPANRTPKIVCAVGSGVDIVTADYFAAGQPVATAAARAKYCPAVETSENRVIPCEAIAKAIGQHRKRKALEDVPSLYLKNYTPKSARDVLEGIVTACGGKLDGTKSAASYVVNGAAQTEAIFAKCLGERATL